MPDRQERDLISLRVAAALHLLRRYATVRYDCLRRDLPLILVGPSHGLGECHASVNICLLNFDHVIAETTTPEDIALILGHEGMHARLARAGFRHEGSQRPRIERLCTKVELVLAARIPGGDSRASYARQRLQWPDSEWSKEASDERAKRTLESMGWQGKLVYRLSATSARILKRLRRGAA